MLHFFRASITLKLIVIESGDLNLSCSIIITLQRLTCKGDIQPKHKQDKQTRSEVHLTINLKH